MTRIPDRCSLKKVFSVVMRVLTIWYVLRLNLRNTTVSAAITGTSTNDSIAMRKFITIIIMASPMILTTLRNRRTIVLAYRSLTASVSLVMRVTILPTGVKSKKRMERLSTCAISSLRRV